MMWLEAEWDSTVYEITVGLRVMLVKQSSHDFMNV